MPHMKTLIVVLLLLAPGVALAQTFHAPAVMQGLGEPIAIVDVNGDGIPDLLTRNGADLLVSLASAPGSLRPPVHYAVGSIVRVAGVTQPSVALGDFNRDGHLDVAAAVTGGIAIALGDGSGHFGAPVVTPAGTQANIVQAIDVNGDGILDLVALVDAETVKVFLGDGAGHFTQSASAHADSNVYFMAAGDFNADGRIDVLTTNDQQAPLLMAGDGAGGLLAAAPVQQSDIAAIAVADFNEDGVPDVVIAPLGGVNLTVTFGKPGFGGVDGTVDIADGPQDTYGESFVRLLAADVNADGHADVIAVNFDGAAFVALGDGHGHFSTPIEIDAPQPNGFALWAAAAGDFDGDGFADVVVSIMAGGPATGYLLTYAPSVDDRARTTETLVKSLDVTAGGIANLLASTTVSLDRLSAADFSKLAALDAPVSSRASQTSIDSLSSSVHAIGVALVSQPSIGGLQSAITDVGTTTQSSIDVASTAATRIAIERALADGVSIVWFTLPASANGQLDTVRQIVADSIAGLQSIGVKIGKAAAAAFAKAEGLFTSGEYVKAYAWYSAAYQALR
jgi:hypothetical protein